VVRGRGSVVLGSLTAITIGIVIGGCGTSSQPADTATSAVSAAGSGSQESDVMVMTWKGNQKETAKKPPVFVPTKVSGVGAGDIEVTIAKWETWGEQQAVGHGAVLVSGGGGSPVRYDNITLTLKQPVSGGDQGGTRHFSVFGISGSDYPAEERPSIQDTTPGPRQPVVRPRRHRMLRRVPRSIFGQAITAPRTVSCSNFPESAASRS
jgi:hypothetical protein